MPEGSRVVILADDLIWADRLTRAVTAAGAQPIVAGTMARLQAAMAATDDAPAVDAVIVDLTARAYDGIVAVELAAAAGVRVLAVGQHDDLPFRKRALAAGAERVLAYQKLATDGPAAIATFLAGSSARAAARA